MSQASPLQTRAVAMPREKVLPPHGELDWMNPRVKAERRASLRETLIRWLNEEL